MISAKATKIFILLLILVAVNFCGEKSNQGQEPDSGPQATLPETAKVLSNSLKVRMGPNTMSSEIGRLSANTEVRLVSRSVDKVKIGQTEAYWYQIKTSDGLKGWVYGAYLSINPEAEKNQAATQARLEKQLQSMMLGRWYAIKKSGSLKTLYMTFFKDEKFEMGFRKRIRSKGTYTLSYEGQRVIITLVDIKKPLVTDIYGELRGVTFTLKGTYRGSEYSFRLTEKAPKSFDPRKRAKDKKKEDAE